MDKQLKEYISNSRKAGQSDLQIMNALTATGWDEEKVLDALRPDLEPPKNSPTKLSIYSPKTLIAAGAGLIVLFGLIGVLLIKLPRDTSTNKQNDKKNTKSNTKVDKPGAGSTSNENTLHPVGSVVISIKKIYTSATNYTSSAFFFDIANQKELTGFPELKFGSNSRLQMSNFSPDGKFVLFKISKYSMADDDDSAKIYLYNAVEHTLKKLFDLNSKNTQKLEKTLYSGYLDKPVWLDEKHAYVAYGLNDDYTKYAYAISIDGSGSEIPFPDNDGLTKNNIIKYKRTNENMYSETYSNIHVGQNTYPFTLKETPIGVHNDQIIAFRHVGLEPLDAADSEKFQKLVQQLVIYQQTKDASGEAAVRQAQADYLSNKSPAAILLIDTATGNPAKTYDSLDDQWKSLNAYYEPFSKNIYVFQVDYLFTPKQERIAKFNLEKENEPLSPIKTFDVSREASQLSSASDALIFDYEGKYMYIPRTETSGTENIVAKYYIYQMDTKTGETKRICGEDCEGIRLFNPNQFVY